MKNDTKQIASRNYSVAALVVALIAHLQQDLAVAGNPCIESGLRVTVWIYKLIIKFAITVRFDLIQKLCCGLSITIL